ncbi:hypothetical protein LUZ63_021157 [Rhynchospora breviuscula]|uniref:Transposase n=1 Tax=Rhynchospora breviuscula TaxID=2022672 RepID=A0A9P9Z749_9POAL|nr:hypothetical protein LUZ63_021157 [Rhynchospora breviuscula]
MRLAGVRGVHKSKRVFTTRSDKTTVLPADLVNRRFTAPAPQRLWVCDVTYVATWSGSRTSRSSPTCTPAASSAGNVASTLRSEILPMQALDMAAWGAGGDLTGLIHHADHGSNYTAMVLHRPHRRTRRRPLDRNGRRLTRQRPGRGDQQPLQDRTDPPARALGEPSSRSNSRPSNGVWWWNNSRLHGEFDMRTPIEVEKAYYADLESANPAPAGQGS